jgi:hypothetical protein
VDAHALEVVLAEAAQGGRIEASHRKKKQVCVPIFHSSDGLDETNCHVIDLYMLFVLLV